MSEIDKLRTELTHWLDDRIAEAVKAGVDEANSDIKADLAKLGFDLNNVGGLVESMSKDVAAVVDSVATLATAVLAIPTDIAKQVEGILARFNPFHI